MPCGSCGQRYQSDSSYTIVGTGKGTKKGVIKKAEFERLQTEANERLTAIKKGKTASPISPNPVVGQSGPANEPE